MKLRYADRHSTRRSGLKCLKVRVKWRSRWIVLGTNDFQTGPFPGGPQAVVLAEIIRVALSFAEALSSPSEILPTMLDFHSLQMATASLAEALDVAKVRSDDMFVRDASIQRFEYTNELCVKSLRRQLEAMSDSPAEIDALGYRDMIHF